MSRIGRMPINVPDKVKVAITGKEIRAEGPKGKGSFTIGPKNPSLVVLEGKVIKIDRPDDSRSAKEMHGITRTLVNNLIVGVSTGFERVLEITGVGFRAEVKGKEIHFTLGFSHPVVFPLPEGVTAEVEKQTKVTVKGPDKHILGLTAAKIRSLRPPEPYKGKGIKYAEETIRRKQGKTGAA
jgi:large subunit ribosomal protein L6